MKPATSLPWIVWNDETGCLIQEEQCEFTHVPTSVAEVYRDCKDAAYIVHACNAYPRLVEALREVIEVWSSYDTSGTLEDARALLAELGKDTKHG